MKMIAGAAILPLIFLYLFKFCDGKQTEKLFANANDLVAHINDQKSSWTAKLHPKFAKMTEEEIQQLMGVRRPFLAEQSKGAKHPQSENSRIKTNIPESFDAREYFPKCSDVIARIQDQSACGSCWAVSVASVITDRICIASNGAHREHISALDILSCEPHSFGCNGGWEDKAFEYYVKSGLCTGSSFEDRRGCKPYPFPPVRHPSHEGIHKTPSCTNYCRNGGYNVTYENDKHYGKTAMMLTDGNVKAIQAEIMRAGPVSAAFLVYQDFVHYASGVYQHLAGSPSGGHAVRIVGWGYDTDSKLPYWLVANSWSRQWGVEGLFKIRMGTNECGIESWGICFADPLI